MMHPLRFTGSETAEVVARPLRAGPAVHCPIAALVLDRSARRHAIERATVHVCQLLTAGRFAAVSVGLAVPTRAVLGSGAWNTLVCRQRAARRRGGAISVEVAGDALPDVEQAARRGRGAIGIIEALDAEIAIAQGRGTRAVMVARALCTGTIGAARQKGSFGAVPIGDALRAGWFVGERGARLQEPGQAGAVAQLRRVFPAGAVRAVLLLDDAEATGVRRRDAANVLLTRRLGTWLFERANWGRATGRGRLPRLGRAGTGGGAGDEQSGERQEPA